MTTRRAFLETLSAGATLLAGCMTDPADETAGDNNNLDVEDTPQSDSNTGQQAEIEFKESELIKGERGNYWSRAEYHNPSDNDHGLLWVNHTIYDSNDDVVATQDPLVRLVPAGTTWRDYSIVLGERADAATSIESSITNAKPEVPAPLEGITIVDSMLNKDFRTQTEITGEIANEGNKERTIRLIGLIYTDDGVLRGSVDTTVFDLASGETRGFQAGIVGQWTPRNYEEELPTQHEVYAFESGTL